MLQVRYLDYAPTISLLAQSCLRRVEREGEVHYTEALLVYSDLDAHQGLNRLRPAPLPPLDHILPGMYIVAGTLTCLPVLVKHPEGIGFGSAR